MLKLFFLIALIPFCCYSQTKITGNVKNIWGENLIGASLIIKNIETNENISYNISNEEGDFVIKFNSNEKQLNLSIRSLGYKSETKIIENITQNINFKLIPEITELKEVILKSTPITKKGDTISYNVSSFASDKDRTIADVLSKMPGIDVLADGKILYQGRPINKYYIEGLDLLEGKYNLANNNLPYNQVSKVQILENHQPIKVLDSLIFSDNAALNIKLKNNVSFTGQAELGIGFEPLLWNNNITPMLFSKNKQMITSYQSNNTGNDVSMQLKTLTIEDLIENFESNNEKKEWLAIQQLNTPNFSEKRWLNNNINIISTNYLQKLKNNAELRLNVSYLNDFQQQNGFTNTNFYTQQDTIKINEIKYNKIFNNSIQSNLTIQKNTKTNYLKNSFQYQGFWDSENGMIERNNQTINQKLNNHYFTFSNKFKNIFNYHNQLLTLNSYINYYKAPQNLVINPGQFEGLLNSNIVYDNLTQNIDIHSFNTNNSLSLTRTIKNFTFTPKIGLIFEKQFLNSTIFVDNVQIFNNGFENQLDWFKTKIYINSQTQYKKNKWRVELNNPVSFNYFKIQDNNIYKKEKLNNFTVEPSLSAVYDLTGFWKFTNSINLKNQFGSIDDMHYSYILRNYRNIQRINSILPQSFSQNFNTGVSYSNPIKSFFGNIYYSYTSSMHNLLFNTNILENGSIEIITIQQDNYKNNHSLTGRLSKFVSIIETNFTFNASISNLTFTQILNDKLTLINTQINSFGFKSNTDISKWADLEYLAKFNISKNRIENQNNNSIVNQSHLLNLNLYPKKNHYIGVKSEYYINDLFTNNQETYFADLIYRYTYKKKNIDFELQYNNIFSTTNFQTISVDNYSYIETNFTLRPTQVLFKIRMSL